MAGYGSKSKKKALYVGVTGHRPNRLPHRGWQRISADLDQVFSEIELRYSTRQCVLTSGLAEGADRLAAFVALGRGWQLRAVLAFDRSRFEEDFCSASSVGEFRALIKACETIEEPSKHKHRHVTLEDCYKAVGERLLNLCEVIVAVWDGASSRGGGGTVEVIKSARRRGIPVIWIHARKTVTPTLLTKDTETN